MRSPGQQNHRKGPHGLLQLHALHAMNSWSCPVPSLPAVNLRCLCVYLKLGGCSAINCFWPFNHELLFTHLLTSYHPFLVGFLVIGWAIVALYLGMGTFQLVWFCFSEHLSILNKTYGGFMFTTGVYQNIAKLFIEVRLMENWGVLAVL